MTTVRSYEQSRLAEAERLLVRAGGGPEGDPGRRLEVLEAAACAYAGIDVAEYWASFCADSRAETGTDGAAVRAVAAELLAALDGPGVPVPLALASLARVELSDGDRRSTGAYYTDFRLAQYLSAGLAPHLTPGARAIDPAAGSGLLLTALALAVGEQGAFSATDFVAGTACAADISAWALRGTRLALAATTADGLKAVLKLDERLFEGDSLLEPAATWERMAPGGFDAVIGNPPWEKLKVTRHELLGRAGVVRHYGADYEAHDELPPALTRERERMLGYLEELAVGAELQGRGEADLYKLFLEFSCRRLSPGGRLALLLPAGLIRSQGTESLRRFLLEHAPELEFVVVENRARFFAIDTRFKFLAVQARIGGASPQPLVLKHAAASDDALRETSSVTVDRAELARLRADLTVPEVRGQVEWDLFRRMAEAGIPFGDQAGRWRPQLSREVDMAGDRADFRTSAAPGHLPVVEGRMVHQYRSRAKAHLSGTGRAARWGVLSYAEAEVRPQYWYPAALLRDGVPERTRALRAGFCDVTGQTNERTLLTAVVPAGVVCGNKVPTVLFGDPSEQTEELVHLWVALMNSLPVDWLARRITTTSVNYFLLLSIPLPPIGPADPAGARIIELSRGLTGLEGSAAPAAGAEAAEARAEIDVLVAAAYGLGPADLEVMLRDFPLLDRGQEPVGGEERSTVTRDLVLARAHEQAGLPADPWATRLARARQAGATAYVPADYAQLDS